MTITKERDETAGQEIREFCQIAEAAQLDAQGHAVRVTVIRGGKSVNGYNYDERALQSIAHLVENAQAYSDHDTSNPTRSIRDMVGFYTDGQYIPPGPGDRNGRVDATLHILEAASWLWSMMSEAISIGRPELIGLSIDIFGQWQLNENTGAKDITRVHSLNSCDVVTRPSAGGSINRILHHVDGEDIHRGGHMDGDTQTAESSALQTAGLSNAQTSGLTNVQTSGSSALQTASITESQQLKDQRAQQVTNSQIIEQMQILETQRSEIQALMQQAQLDRSALTLERRLQESLLPSAVKEQIKGRFSGRIFEESELETEMTAALTMMSQLTREGLVRGHNYEKPEIGSQITEAEKVQAAFDKMFDLDVDTTKFGNVQGFNSIREAYTRVTGSSSLQGGISSHSNIGQIRVNESAPIDRITETDTTTASFSYLLGTSMNKRLLKDYQAWPAEWQKFCTIAPIRDFKQQSRVRLGAFASLPVVAEDSAYTAVTLSDSAATYVPQKRGNLVTVSRETIINDDLQSIKQIPTKLAVAAAYTLAEFVYSFLSANPNIYDGNALFTSGAPHSNLGSSALSSASMQTGITAMREQTNFAGKRIGLRPRYLIVPPELEFVSMVVTKSAGVPGSNNNDINPMLGYVTPIVAPQLSSATQWFFAGDPREIDTIEIGFVGGQVNPALFIQDAPLFGLNFTNDAVSYKIRHEYGGAITDFRGLYRGI